MIDSVINERYQIGEKLGEGGMAVVYQATDLESGDDVALKVMKSSLSGTAQRRFAREFRAIASVDHPNCIKVFDFAETQDCPFFTMELFRGQPITQLIDQELPLVLSALYQAVSAVEYVHGQQIIHRDLKPSNLLTRIERDGGEGGRVTLKLADFGLARFYGTPSSLSIDSGFVGTLAYSSPEQISSGAVDNRCDLYSLGVVCYEILTGRHPFEKARRSGTQSLIRAHLAEVPLSIRATRRHVPAELEELILSLLEKQPSKRPPSAASLKTLLAGYLGIDEQISDEGTTTALNARWTGDAFVARENELVEVSGLMTQSLSPIQFSLGGQLEKLAPSVVFVTGEAGIGKSHFLREVARLARRHGADVLEGRCFEGNLSPYQPFVEIVRQMLTQLGSLSSHQSNPDLHRASSERASDRRETQSLAGTEAHSARKETVQDVVRNYAAELLRIAPDLHQWLPGKAFRQIDLSREANYVLRAIATFFVEVATLHGTCLLIEDMHWADQSSIDLLRHIASILHRNREQSVESNRSYPRLFICCTARPDNAQFSRELERERYAKVVPLGSLTPAETRQLVAMALNVRPEQISLELIEHVSERCKGNPYFITESLRLWQSTGRIVRPDRLWTLDNSEGSSADWPDSVRGVLRSRLKAISSSAQQVLGSCAVIGSIIDVDLLRQTVPEMSENDFLDAVDEMLARQIVFETATSGNLEFSHDLLRELTYEQLPAHRCRALHRRVGEVLERTRASRTSKEQLASHFYEARVVDRAYRYLLDASEAALASYAIDEALRHLNRAAELEREIDDPEQKCRLHAIMATAHSAAGRPKEAIGSYQRQLALCADRVETGRVLAEIGELQFRIGDFDEAVNVFDRSLAQIGYRRPRFSVAVVFSTIVSFLRHALPQSFHLAWIRRPDRRKRLQVAHRVFSTLELLWAQRNVLHCGQAHGRHLILADQIGEPSCLIHASARQALIFGIFSVNGLALRAGRFALASAQQMGDAEAEAIAKGHVGCAHYFGARLQDAERLLREAVAVLDRRGDSWERMYFYHNLRHLYSITGDAEREIECACVEMQIGEAVNDPEGTCWGAYGVANALARSGKHEEAHQYMQRALGILSGRINIVVTPTALQTYGFVHLQSGDYEAACDVLEESCKNIRHDWSFIEYTVRAYPLLVESLLGPRWHDCSAEHDEKIVRRSWRISRFAKFCAWRFPNYMPHALRVRGRAAWLLGKRKRAIACFHRAITVGENIGARFDVARACIDLSKLDIEGREQYERRGLALLDELGAVLPVGEDERHA